MVKNFNIGIVGLGYVGKAILNGFSSENILTFDTNKACTEKSLKDLSNKADIVFVCVPTPMNQDGTCCLDHVDQVLLSLNSFNKNQEVVIKSTIPPGSCDNFKSKYPNLNIIFNPEFLTEANFYEDFIGQKRIILGLEEVALVDSLYQKHFPEAEIIKLNFKEAEMVKYFSNSFLALKVSYANEMYSLCNKLNIDYNKVIKAAAKDKRIGDSHLNVPGPDGKKGFGGTCFPKDMKALLSLFDINNVESFILKASWERNKKIDRKVQDWKHLKGRAIVE
jgi:UDPglucose 6-dehydrogenase